jgi:hypothetical protein
MSRRKLWLLGSLAILALLTVAGCPLAGVVGFIQLQIDPAAASKGIDSGEFPVTGLEIRLRDPEGQDLQTIRWKTGEGSRSYLIPVREAGEHEIEVTHLGIRGEEAIQAVEASVFEVQAKKITVIDIVPGCIGVIRVQN